MAGAAGGKNKQKMAEKFNKATGFRYTAEFEASCQLMEGMGQGTKELVERLKKHLDTFHNGGVYYSEALADASENLGAGLAQDSAYGLSLHSMSKAEKGIGKAERVYVKDVQEKVVSVFQDWLVLKFKAFKKERETLEKMRCDMDRAANKVRENPMAAELKVAEETFTKDHTNQLAVVQRLLEQLPLDLDIHKQAVSKFLALQHTLHSACLTSLDPLLKEIVSRITA